MITMSLNNVDKTRGRIIAALQEETEDGWIVIDNELFEIFHKMYQKIRKPIFKPGGTDEMNRLIDSINNLRAEGFLEERGGGELRITGFRLRLESPDAIPLKYVELLEELADEVLNN